MITKLIYTIEKNSGSKNFFWKSLTFGRNTTQTVQDKIVNIDQKLYLSFNKTLILPDFLGIGAQKSGSSWVGWMLRHHPEIYMPYKKELHYFNKNIDKDLYWYSYFFRKAKNKTKGEITPAYATLPLETIKKIKQSIPDLKIFYMLRNPIDRAWSHAKMDLVSHSKKKFDQIKDEEFINHFRGEGSLKRGDYLTCINNWKSEFNDDQIRILYYEELIADPKKLIIDILKHIGVSAELNWKKTPLNSKIGASTHKSPIPEKYKTILIDLYEEKIKKLYNKIKNPIIKDWLSD